VHLPAHGVGVGETVGVAVAVPVAVAGGVAVAVAVAGAFGVGGGAAQGLTGELQVSLGTLMARVRAWPAAFPVLLLPSVSAAKLRPAIANGVPTDHVLLVGS